MSRRTARELVLQSLFQIDLAGAEPKAALAAAKAEHSGGQIEEAAVYAEELLQGVLAKYKEIDAKLAAASIGWPLWRMPATDRNIMRLAAYELLYAPEPLSPPIAINEAVELAKVYGTDDSPRFINGVLGRLTREK